MGRSLSATDARIHFADLMRHVVEKQEAVVVERYGEPQVVILSVDEYQRLLAAAAQRPDWQDLVSRARDQVRTDLAGGELPPPQEVLRRMREDRSQRLPGPR